MAERRAVNKYYPPDWDPSKGSINTYLKSHPLRARARKLNKGILVIRFEMPFNIWCSGCKSHIAMGVRFNADKIKVGNYYTSPIYQFKMKCSNCDNHFVLQTDPSKFDYIIVEGATKRTLPVSGPDEDDLIAQQALNDAEEAKRRIQDSMFRLEKKVEDKMKSDLAMPNLHEIKKWRSKREDSFELNQLIRSQYRKSRKRIEQTTERDKRLLKRASLKISLVASSPSQKNEAKKLLSKISCDKLKDSECSKKSAILDSKNFIRQR